MSYSPKQLVKILPAEAKILEELILVDQALEAGLGKILINPKLKKARKEIIEAILAPEISENVRKLLFFLTQENQLKIFKKILTEYQRQMAEQKKALRAEIITALPLAAHEQKMYQEKIGAKLKTEVLLKNKVDPQIIGGAIIKIESLTIDNSFRTRLKAIR